MKYFTTVVVVWIMYPIGCGPTVYPKKYAHGFVVLCFVVVMQSFIINSYEVFIHIHQGCFAGTGAIVRLPQCQWSKPDGYEKISQCITTTKHSKAKTVCIFLGIYYTYLSCPVLYNSNLRIAVPTIAPAYVFFLCKNYPIIYQQIISLQQLLYKWNLVPRKNTTIFWSDMNWDDNEIIIHTKNVLIDMVHA